MSTCSKHLQCRKNNYLKWFMKILSLHNHIFLMCKIWLRIPHLTQNSFDHLLVVNARKILSPVFGQPLAQY